LSTRIIGLDPGLRKTGWGVIDYELNRLSHVAHGVINVPQEASLAKRLDKLFEGLWQVIELYKPNQAAVEETFVNTNPLTTLKLGMARGIVMLVPARFGIEVGEYAPNKVKKSLCGAGHADKDQMMTMIKYLLPKSQNVTADSADALAVAICHGNHMQTNLKWRAA